MSHIFIFNLVGLAALICLSISPGVKKGEFKINGTLLSRKTGKPVKDTLVEITGVSGEVLYWSKVEMVIERREAKIKTDSQGYFRISIFTEEESATFQINATTDLPKKYSVTDKDGGRFWKTYASTSVGQVYMEDKTGIVKRVKEKVNEFKEVFDEELDRRTPR